MSKRPTSVTVVGWILAIIGGTAAVGSLTPLMPTFANDPKFMEAIKQNGLPVNVTVAIGVVNSLVVMLCGIGFLKGWSWSRWLYLFQVIAGFLLTLATVGTTIGQLPSLLLAAVVLLIVFRPAANAFFVGHEVDPFEDHGWRTEE